MIENNCSCSVLSNKIDKSIIRRYDNNKGRKRSGLDKRKLQAVEKAIESLAPQGFLPVRRAPLVRALASHAGGRRLESASLHHVKTPLQSELLGVGHSGVFLISHVFSMLSRLAWCKESWTRKSKTHKIRPQNVKSTETELCSPAHFFSVCLAFS